MFEIIFAQIFSFCQTWPFHIRDDSLKNQIYLGVFGCVGCSEFVPRHIPSENMFFVNQAFEEKCQDLKTKRKCLTETPLTTKTYYRYISIFFVKNYLCQLLWFPSQWNLWKAVGLKRLSTGYPAWGPYQIFFPHLIGYWYVQWK